MAAVLSCFVLLVIGAIIGPLVSSILNNLGYVSSVFIWLGFVIIVLAYVANLGMINRSLTSSFSINKIILAGSALILLSMITIFIEDLAPDQAHNQAYWGWMSALGLILVAMTFIAHALKPKPSSLDRADFHLDDPTDNSIELSDTQRVIYDRLHLIINSTIDTSIALTGNWGIGKTKVLHKLRLSSEDIIWVQFYPWAYSSEEALIKDFYAQLVKEIDNAQPRITMPGNKVMGSIRRLIDGAAIQGLGTTIAGIFVDMTGVAKEPEDIIADRMQDQELRVIVVVDDLERVYDKALINRTLQLVHHLKRRNIKGVRFVTAFERDAVLGALPEHAQKNNSTFIEKFFDIEVMLPDPLRADLEAQLIKLIPEQLRPNFIPSVVADDLVSHRAVIRLANEYKLAGSISSSGIDLNAIVNMDDFIVLAHIKLKYPFLYRDISRNRHIYTQYHEGEERDEKLIAYFMMQEEEQREYKKQHLESLIREYGLESDTDKLKEMLGNIFPDLAKALGDTGSRSNDFNTQRRERRLGLRMVLDAALGMFSKVTEIIAHEEKARTVLDVLEAEHTQDQIKHSIQELVSYCISIGHDGWDVPLHILTNELDRRDELHEHIPELVKAWIEVALGLDSNFDNHIRTRLLGQAFYVFTDNLLYSGIQESEKQELVNQLSITKLIDAAQTPFGSLLMSRDGLSREFNEVRKYLTADEKNLLRVKRRRHYERYYGSQEHDVMSEAQDVFTFLKDGWEDSTKKYPKGMVIYSSWLKTTMLEHPSYFLDEYTTKTYRGSWAFKEADFGGTTKPVKDIPYDKLQNLVKLVEVIEHSDKLSTDDELRIKMIKDYAEEHPQPTDVEQEHYEVI